MDSMQGQDEAIGTVISGLVENSKVTADDIAAAVLAGMEAGEDVIVPDEAARQAYFLKWADRAAYDDVMRHQAARLEEVWHDVRRTRGGRVRRRRRGSWLRGPGGRRADRSGGPQFSGGASNLTYLLQLPGRDLILRRAPGGTKAKGAHDMRREFTIQSALAPVFPYVAPMIGFCDDESVIGGDFYAMGRIDGLIPRSTWPSDVPLSPEQARQLCLNVVEVYAELHTVDVEPRPASPSSARAPATSGARSRAGRRATATRTRRTTRRSRRSWPGWTPTSPRTSPTA